LKRNDDPFLAQWEIVLTTRDAKREYWGKIDGRKTDDVEVEVSKFIRDNFMFSVFRVDDNKSRLQWESKLISTVSLCEDCRPSTSWLGLHSPKKKIVESGLWVVNELYKQGIAEEEFRELEKHVFDYHH
jgi:hypothetical protein